MAIIEITLKTRMDPVSIVPFDLPGIYCLYLAVYFEYASVFSIGTEAHGLVAVFSWTKGTNTMSSR